MQVESTLGSRGHALAVYKGRIYDAAEFASMPLEPEYLDRCVKENMADMDTFKRFFQVL